MSGNDDSKALAAVPEPPDRWTDAQLAGRIAEALRGVSSPRQVRFAQERAAGATIRQAAARASLALRGGAPYMVAARPAVAELVLLLREEARRKAAFDHATAIQEFRQISDAAFACEDWEESTRALVEAARISALYPEKGANNPWAPQVPITLNFDLRAADDPALSAAHTIVDVGGPRLGGPLRPAVVEVHAQAAPEAAPPNPKPDPLE